MKRALLALACMALVLPAAVHAQSNDDDYTPLNSRIKRDRQFPTDLMYRFDPSKWTGVQKDRSKQMSNQFANCLWRRSHEHSLAFLAQTDMGFVDFPQIGQTNEKAARVFGIMDCLGRVADSADSGVQMRWTAAGIRQWLLQEAYFDQYPDKPDWVKPGIVIDERPPLPLSKDSRWVTSNLDLADCVVAADPYSADLYFRSATGSPLEKEVLNALVPLIGPCLPEDVQMQIQPDVLRVSIGEALWHASQHNRPAPAESAKGSE
jgi:hypothetical protein